MYDPEMPEIIKSDFDRGIAMILGDNDIKKYVIVNGPDHCRLVFIPKIESLFWDCLIKYVDNSEVAMYINNNSKLRRDYVGGRVIYSELTYPEFDKMYIRICDYLYKTIKSRLENVTI